MKPRRSRPPGVVVTGGAAGIGRTVVESFARDGASVTVLDSDGTKGTRLATRLQQRGFDVRFLQADLGNLKELPPVEALFHGRTGARILINNVAVPGRIAPFLDLTSDDLESVLRANVVGTCAITRYAAQALIRRRVTGAIVNVLAIQSVNPVPGHSSYIASKGALDALTHSLAAELAPHGIRVNGVQVGPVITPRLLSQLPSTLRAEARRTGVPLNTLLDRRAATLLGRLGRPNEIAEVVRFLASDAASFLVGSIVRADGGRLISRRPDHMAPTLRQTGSEPTNR